MPGFETLTRLSSYAYVLPAIAFVVLAFVVLWWSTRGGGHWIMQSLKEARGCGVALAVMPLLAVVVCLLPARPGPDGLGADWAWVFTLLSCVVSVVGLVGLTIRAAALHGRAPPEDDELS